VPPRYRCGACGNVTRFDVTATRRTRAFHHFTIGGELTVEDEEVLAEEVESVSCRWCASPKAVEALAEGDDPAPATGGPA
jgi:hypothetical protein